jgi:hypothetical protein
VAVEVSAESKEAAIQIAAAHGVAVEQIVPVSNVAQPPSAAPPRSAGVPAASSGQDARAPGDEDADEGVDHLLDSSDDDLDDLDLGDGTGAPPATAGQQATKACPYCGEQVLAVAIKCKHCGSYLAEIAPATAQPALAPLARAKVSRAKASRLWWMIGGPAAGVAVIAVVLWVIFHQPSTPTPRPTPAVASQPGPSPPLPVVVKPEPPKHSADELAFAAKLSAFLDACDDMAKLLEGVPKREKVEEQTKVLKACWAAIPPPKGVAWEEDAIASSKHFMELADMLPGVMAQAELIGSLAQSPGGGNAVGEIYRKAGSDIRDRVKNVRALIPPDCLPKSG